MENELHIFSEENLEQELTEREKRILNRVLAEYEFKIIDYKKVRNAYKVETSQGDIYLKRIFNRKHKSYNIAALVEELAIKGFFSSVKYYKTKKGDTFVKYKKMLFCATEWIEGIECNFNNIHEVVNCTKLLAKFHLTTNEVNVKKMHIKNNIKNWPNIFNENLSDFERFEKIITRKRMKTEFDIAYYNYIETMSYRGVIALNLLNTSQYYKLSKNAEKDRTICHDSFCYKDIIKRDDKYYLTNLDNVMIDMHVNDLAKLIRRAMFKTHYRWDFNKAKAIIEAYNSINKLNKNELEIMLALIIFPHKFWKLGKRRYIKHKSWDEIKYMRKLNKIIRYDKMQEEFIQNYLSYLKYYL